MLVNEIAKVPVPKVKSLIKKLISNKIITTFKTNKQHTYLYSLINIINDLTNISKHSILSHV